MSSFSKYQAGSADASQGNGRGSLSFRRAHIDGMPFRGSGALLRENEYEEFTETVNDGYVDVFDMDNEEHKRKLNEIIDAAANNWYKVYRMKEEFVPQPDGSLRVFVYVVWAEPYRELAKHRIPSELIQKQRENQG